MSFIILVLLATCPSNNIPSHLTDREDRRSMETDIITNSDNCKNSARTCKKLGLSREA